MKISPVGSPASVVNSAPVDAPQNMTQRIRSLRMSTNATPGRVEEPPAADPALSLPANSENAQTDEATTQPLSPQYAELARRRRSLQVKEREVADREKALEAQPPAQGDVVTKAQLMSNPLGVLLDAGVTYEQLTEAVLANQNGYNPEIRELKEKIASLEAGFDKKLTDKDVSAKQAALSEMKREANQLCSVGEEFELVRATNSVPTVMQLIEKTYDTTGEVMDVSEALKLVESELLKDNLKIANLKKIQSQFAPQAPVFPPQQQRQMRTLTNRDTASVPMSPKARALAAFNGTLKK